MNTIFLNSRSIDNFFSFLSKMDLASKKKLIIKLTESIESSPDSKNLKSLYGSWIDTRESDQIIKEIKESRVNERKIIDF